MNERRDPDSIKRCKICKGEATRWYKLMATTVYRCEEHRKQIESPVYDQGKLSTRGEEIGLEENPTYESGVSKVTEYMEKSGVKFNKDKLQKEIRSCSDDLNHQFIDPIDSNKIEKINKFVKHLKQDHPILYSIITYVDDTGLHNLLIDHPDEYFRTIQSFNQVRNHYKKPIPVDLVGTDVSARELKR